MGGASRSSSVTSTRKENWVGAIREYSKEEWLHRHQVEKTDCRAHVEAFRKHQEWINRPWTWKNRLAAVINWLLGN